MPLTYEELLKYAYNRCLPEIYRDRDSDIGNPLYRYMQSIIEGGCNPALQDVEGLLSLVDPETCPEEFFPYLYESFGFQYYPDVDVKYHRKFLMNFGELRRRRGTYSCVRFLVRVLTSMDAKQSYLRGIYDGQDGRHLIIDLQANSAEDIINMELSVRVIEQFLTLFVPYYITTHLTNSVKPIEVKTTRYRGYAISSTTKYTIGGSQEVTT